LIVLVSIIFGKVLGVCSDALELTVILSVVVVANAALSTWLERRGFGPTAALRQFVVTGLLNLGIFVVLVVGIGFVSDEPVVWRNLGFFLLLVTLLITLYDRYRPEYRARFAPAEAAGTAVA
jgi:hypothetical protein